MKMQIANDLGNSSLKIMIDDQPEVIPSVIAAKRAQDDFDPLRLGEMDNEAEYMNNFLEHLDITVQSPAVKDVRRFLVGASAVNSTLSAETFDINDLTGKSKTDLAMILTLGTIAGEAVRRSYKSKKKLDVKTINVTVDMTTALPIMEGKANGAVDAYEHRFLDQAHQVTIRNFDHLITVNITFEKVIVALEGEIAQYRILNAKEEFANLLLKAFQETNDNSAITADTLISAGNVLGIDIGSGTTDIPVFEQQSHGDQVRSELNVHASASIQSGYGRALDEAVNYLQSQQIRVNNRLEIERILSAPADPFSSATKKTVQKAVDAQMGTLAHEIVDKVSQVLSRAAGRISVIYVYGGGSIPLKKYLTDPLIEKTKAFNGGQSLAVVFVPKDFAPYMNESGLKLLLDRLEEQ